MEILARSSCYCMARRLVISVAFILGGLMRHRQRHQLDVFRWQEKRARLYGLALSLGTLNKFTYRRCRGLAHPMCFPLGYAGGFRPSQDPAFAKRKSDCLFPFGSCACLFALPASNIGLFAFLQAYHHLFPKLPRLGLLHQSPWPMPQRSL